MRKSYHLVLLGLLLAALSACGVTPAATIPDAHASSERAALTAVTNAPGDATTLHVFAAASLTDAFREIGAVFEAEHPGVTVTFNFAGSNQLAQQIKEGAPADVFASANKTQMDGVIAAGQVISGNYQIFAQNRLVVIYPRENPAGLQSLQDLAKSDLKLVLAAKEVPAGQYALDFLGKASQLPEYTPTFSDTVAANVVSYEESVRAVLSKVSLGEADAGIVYTSDVAGAAANQVGRLNIPDELNTIANYPIAPIKDAPHAEIAEDFVTYILSPAAQMALDKYGFIPIAGDAGGGASLTAACATSFPLSCHNSAGRVR